jgi:hypothetical protein
MKPIYSLAAAPTVMAAIAVFAVPSGALTTPAGAQAWRSQPADQLSQHLGSRAQVERSPAFVATNDVFLYSLAGAQKQKRYT